MPKLEKNRVKVPYIASDGIELPGVTTVLGILDKPALKQWAWNQGKLGIPLYKATEGALDVGTITHYLIECYVKGEEPDLSPEFPSEVVDKSYQLLELFKLRWASEGYKLIHSEIRLIDEKRRFGGTIDLLVEK